MNKLKWAVACDDDADPRNNVAHMMELCECDDDDGWCQHDLEIRYPICGQTFGEGWTYIDAEDQRHCKKCTAKLMREAADG